MPKAESKECLDKSHSGRSCDVTESKDSAVSSVHHFGSLSRPKLRASKSSFDLVEKGRGQHSFNAANSNYFHTTEEDTESFNSSSVHRGSQAGAEDAIPAPPALRPSKSAPLTLMFDMSPIIEQDNAEEEEQKLGKNDHSAKMGPALGASLHSTGGSVLSGYTITSDKSSKQHMRMVSQLSLGSLGNDEFDDIFDEEELDWHPLKANASSEQPHPLLATHPLLTGKESTEQPKPFQLLNSNSPDPVQSCSGKNNHARKVSDVSFMSFMNESGNDATAMSLNLNNMSANPLWEEEPQPSRPRRQHPRHRRRNTRTRLSMNMDSDEIGDFVKQVCKDSKGDIDKNNSNTGPPETVPQQPPPSEDIIDDTREALASPFLVFSAGDKQHMRKVSDLTWASSLMSHRRSCTNSSESTFDFSHISSKHTSSTRPRLFDMIAMAPNCDQDRWTHSQSDMNSPAPLPTRVPSHHSSSTAAAVSPIGRISVRNTNKKNLPPFRPNRVPSLHVSQAQHHAPRQPSRLPSTHTAGAEAGVASSRGGHHRLSSFDAESFCAMSFAEDTVVG